jgi:hypothetical protein
MRPIPKFNKKNIILQDIQRKITELGPQQSNNLATFANTNELPLS